MIVVSIIGIDELHRRLPGGEADHERAALAGPIPVRFARASQFHEFVGQLVDWGRQGDVAYVGKLRTQLVAARARRRGARRPGARPRSTTPGLPTVEIAGPQEENLVDLAIALMANAATRYKIVGATDTDDPDAHLNESGALLPGPTRCSWARPSRSGSTPANGCRSSCVSRVAPRHPMGRHVAGASGRADGRTSMVSQ